MISHRQTILLGRGMLSAFHLSQERGIASTQAPEEAPGSRQMKDSTPEWVSVNFGAPRKAKKEKKGESLYNPPTSSYLTWYHFLAPYRRESKLYGIATQPRDYGCGFLEA